MPTKEDIESLNSTYAFSMMEQFRPECEPKQLSAMFVNEDTSLDLLSKLLQFNPNKRITAHDALEHPWLQQFHRSDRELVCLKPIQVPMNDNTKFPVSAYREALYASIVRTNISELFQQSAQRARKSQRIRETPNVQE